jgi:integrase
VFTCNGRAGLNRSNLANRVLKPAVADLGLPRVTFHSFRHTCASLLFEQGRNVRQVADWLGHSDPAYTLRTYVHLLDDGCVSGFGGGR